MDDRLVSVNQLQELAYQFYFDRRITELDLFLINRAIEEMPTVDAEPVRHGHWIDHYDNIWPEESTWECSLCHEEQGRGMLDTNYCPNCGAKMDEEK